MKCPKCNYERLSTDSAPMWQCPSCKVAYAKVSQSKGSIATTIEADRDEKEGHDKEKQTSSAQTQTSTQAQLEEHALYERQWLAARGQRMVIYSILLNFFLRAVQQSHVLPDLAIEALFICIAVYSLMGVVKICSGLGKTQNKKVLFMVLSFFPFINLIVLVYLSVTTTKILRDAGWEVGFLGAKP